MPRVLLLATTTGYQTRAFGDAAERLGVELVFATDRCDQIDDPWRDGAIAIRFHEEARSVDAIVSGARSRPLDGLLVVGDRPTVIAARVAEAFGWPGHPPEAAAAARNKLLTRQRLRDAGLLVPWFKSFQLSALRSQPSAESRKLRAESRELMAESFPCVVKPLSLSGSRGVIRADDASSYAAAIARLGALLASPDVRGERNAAHETVLVEEFIPGREYAVEALMDHGRLHVLAVFDKPDPLDGPFFEETIYVTPSAAPLDEQRAITGAVAHAAEALGLTHGPIHAECRVNTSGVFVLEVAARPIGGLCARSLRFELVLDPNSRIPGTPRIPNAPRVPNAPRMPSAPRIPNRESRITLEELLLLHALGETPDNWSREREASGVMMIPIPRRGVFRGVDGLDAAKAVPHVTDVRITAKPDQLLVPLPEGASYPGFIFATARTPRDAERALRSAHAALRFWIEAEVPVLSPAQIHYNHTHG